MKNITFILLFLNTVFGFAQVQTITYSISPNDFIESENITITFNGSSIDESAWGVADNSLYLWSWSYDLNFGNEQDSPTNGSWTNSDEANRLTYNSGTDTYSISFVPNTFYNRTGIGRIGFLLKAKNGDGDKKSQDILKDLTINQLTLTSPTEDPIIVDAGTLINISATTIFSSGFSLKANGVEVDTATGINNYSFDFTVTEGTDFILEADDGIQVLSEAFSARITPLFPVPNGLLDGLNLDPTDNTKATLVLFAPNKQTVHVIGDFNNWQEDANYLMNEDTARDRFWIELSGLTPQFDHMYQYLVDSNIRIADPYSTIILDETQDQFLDAVTYPNLPQYPTGSTNHAVTLLRTGDANFNWQVTNFNRPEKTDLVIYELLIRDFDELHSFDAVKARLDYIQTLGANAIELMPVNEFDGNLSWGYNPSFHMALDKYYGTADAFKQLIDECHNRGIAVIIDVVYNHASGQHPFYRLWNTDNGGYNGQANADSPFFNQSATHAYSVFNDFNHQSNATRNYVERTVKYWINEFKIDGFRWDLTKGFTQNCSSSDEGCTNGLQQDRIDVLKDYADYQWEVDPNFYIIFEHLGGITEEKQWADYRANEGKGIMLWNKQTDPYNEATIGDHADGKSNISNVSYTKKGFDGPSAVSYMESHDEQRIMYRNLDEGESNGAYSVKDLNTALERMETAGAFFFTVPGPKMIWQFGELGYEVDINFNGRTGNKPIRWEYVDDPNRKAIYATWANLIDLKLNAPIFKTSVFSLDGDTSGLKTIHLTLPSATGDEIKYVTIIGNFGLTSQNIDPEFQEIGTWYNLLDNNNSTEVINTSTLIALEPGEFRVYGNNPYVNPNDLDSDGIDNASDNCPNTANADQLDTDGDGTGDVCDDDDDDDGILDISDNCPLIANVDQADFDGDGVGDVCDNDSDNDGVDNASDNCPDIANADQADLDNDGIGDVCDDDDDGDGILDITDNCPLTANANQADFDNDGEGDVCDEDDDNDGILDVNDNCSLTVNADQADLDNYGIGDVCDDDDDNDGVLDGNDVCANTPFGTTVDVTGCEVFNLPANNFTLQIAGESCRNSNDGSINITAVENLNYTVAIIGNSVNSSNSFTTNYIASDMEAGNYVVCITVDGEPDYELCFNVRIEQPEDLSVLSRIGGSKNSIILDLSGSTVYRITLNETIIETSNTTIELDLTAGTNNLKVLGEKDCQGIYEETIILNSDILVYPNPINDNIFYLNLGLLDLKNIQINMFSVVGQIVYQNNVPQSSIINIDVSKFAEGIYILNIESNTFSKSFKIIKQ